MSARPVPGCTCILHHCVLLTAQAWPGVSGPDRGMGHKLLQLTHGFKVGVVASARFMMDWVSDDGLGFGRTGRVINDLSCTVQPGRLTTAVRPGGAGTWRGPTASTPASDRA
eukprot:3840470-Rhodomonas_salina.1